VACDGDTSGREINLPRGPHQNSVGCTDMDADGIADGAERMDDPDGDGVASFQDLDSDGDGLDDDTERAAPPCTNPRDTDVDGKPDFLDLDSDNDGVPDAQSDRVTDTDGDGLPNGRDADDDGDNVVDSIEIGADPAAPRDSDGDGLPNYLDPDSDGDGVHDSPATLSDIDMDGVEDYLDDDADGDGLLDTLEIGADPLAPRNTDGDQVVDWLDADSDGDGLADGREDSDRDGVVDAGESSPILSDTDGDGADDLVEHAAATDPADPTKNPAVDGNFVFIVPFEAAPMPAEATLDFATSIHRADVVFSMDTTGSMGSALEALRTNLSAQIVPALVEQIPDLGLAISSYEDFPVDGFGGGGDLPFRLATPVTLDVMEAQAGLATLFIGSGGDGPESGIEALYQIATGAGVSWTGFAPGSVTPFEMGFREGALPIVIQITDAENHSAATYLTAVPEAASRQAAQDALAAISAKVINVNVGQSPVALSDALELVTESGAVVPPAAFGVTGMCLTGLAGAATPPNAAGECPLLFHVAFDGSGLGNSIVDAVQALAGFANLDIDARPANEDGNVDAAGTPVDPLAAFLESVQPNANPDAATGCTKGFAIEDRLASDGVEDTFVDVSGNARVCFDVLPKMNTTVMPSAEPQLFRARIDVYGDNITQLDSRQVWFVVPPKPPEPGVCAGLDAC
jgi:hypothetical protein